MTLTHPARFRAWVLVRLRSLPPGLSGGSWAARWRAAAHIYRDRAINTMQGLRMAQEDIRRLQDAFDEQNDKRPLSGGELDSYIVGLRERCEALAMHTVDLTRERDAATADVALLNESCQAWIESEAGWRRRAEAAEAAVLQLRQAIRQYQTECETPAPFHDPDLRWQAQLELFAIASQSDAGAALLSQFEAMRAYQWAARSVLTGAVAYLTAREKSVLGADDVIEQLERHARELEALVMSGHALADATRWALRSPDNARLLVLNEALRAWETARRVST